MLAEAAGDGGHGRHGLGIVHAGGPEDADGAPDPSFDVEAGQDDGALPEILELVLGPDPDGDTLVDQVAHQADDEVLVLEDLEQATHRLTGGEGVEVGGDAAGPADVDRFGGPADGPADKGVAGLLAELVGGEVGRASCRERV